MTWNPERYHQFQKERSAPFDDILNLVKVRPDLKAIDLGCGTGELTVRLADLLPDGNITGIDSSVEMLARAQPRARLGLRFILGYIQTVGGAWDLIFSNAALQWVDDHPQLIRRLFGLLRPNGQLVVQAPSNHHHPVHRLIAQIAGEEPFRAALGSWTRPIPVLSIDDYTVLLYELGAADVTVYEKVYPHVLADADALADWTSGTALVPYFERLSEPLRAAFMEQYRAALWQQWPAGPVYYGFRRTLFAATRA